MDSNSVMSGHRKRFHGTMFPFQKKIEVYKKERKNIFIRFSFATTAVTA